MNVAAASINSNVTSAGCHIDRNMCFVYIEAPIQSSCSLNDNSLRWDGVNSKNVKSALAILLATKTAGQKVTFGGVGANSNTELAQNALSPLSANTAFAPD